jgi:hypothetical protein
MGVHSAARTSEAYQTCQESEEAKEMNLLSLEGKTFGNLLVTNRASNDRFGQARWNCRCACGNVLPFVLSQNWMTNAEQALHKRNRRALLLWFMRSTQ